MKRKTISRPIILSGAGLHTGKESIVTISPVEGHTGIKLAVKSGDKYINIPVDAGSVTSTLRSTNLGSNHAEVICVEHLFSAIQGLGITDCEIKVDGPEIPIFDGSALPFAKAIHEAGLSDIEGEIEPIEIQEIYTFEASSGSSYTVMPSDHLELTTLVEFDDCAMAQQYAHYTASSDYLEEIAPSKTFVFTNEVERLLQQDLIKGGSLKNAIVIANDHADIGKIQMLAQKMDVTLGSPEEGAVLNKSVLTFPNELARHKILDLMGDLTLIGRPLKAKIIAHKPGHAGNVELARELKRIGLELRKLRGKPKYDPDQEPVMDLEAIKRTIPHRYPFLLVDKIIELSESTVVGVKSITFNEALFQGHFPGNPVFPGVLQMEALAQTGGILALNNVEDPSNWDTYFLKMDAVKFKNKVVPGDTLILKMELLEPIRRGIVHMKGTAYVGNKVVSEGELTAQIVKREA